MHAVSGPWSQDADDGVLLGVKADLFADNVAVAAESFLPIGIAEDNDRIGAGGLPFGRENQAAQGRLEAKD